MLNTDGSSAKINYCSLASEWVLSSFGLLPSLSPSLALLNHLTICHHFQLLLLLLLFNKPALSFKMKMCLGQSTFIPVSPRSMIFYIMPHHTVNATLTAGIVMGFYSPCSSFSNYMFIISVKRRCCQFCALSFKLLACFWYFSNLVINFSHKSSHVKASPPPKKKKKRKKERKKNIEVYFVLFCFHSMRA